MQVVQTKRMGQSGSGVAARPANAEGGHKPKKSKKSIRMAGGQMWEDSSLAEWDQNDFRRGLLYLPGKFCSLALIS
jgi:hypothetical protein